MHLSNETANSWNSRRLYQFYHFPLVFITNHSTRMPVLQTQVAWSISYYNPPLPCPGMHAQKLFHVLPHALRVRESLILHRVTLAVTKCHGMVSLKANFHGSQCRNKICDNFLNQLAISESEFSVLGSLCLLLLQFRLIIWAVRSLLISPMTWYSGFFLLSFVTRFACDIGQSAKIWIWVFLRSSTFADSGWSVDQVITSLLATPC